MNYKKLTVGDVRQEGDEQASRLFTGGVHMRPDRKDDLGMWKQTQLVGHPILASDLIHLELRRPQ